MAIDIVVRANSKQAVKELKALGYQVKSVGKDTGKYTDKLLKAGAAYFSVTAANKLFRMGLSLTSEMLQTLIVDMATWGDRMAKQARMVGMTAEQYQGLEFAAERSGTSITHVGHGLKKLGRVMVDANSGSKQLSAVFDALGVNITKTDGTLKDTFDVFLELSDKSMILGESAERTGVLMLLLGRSGTEMANLMSDGSEGILEMQDRLDELNATMSAEGLLASETFIDNWTDVKMALRGVKIELAEELIPAAAVSLVIWSELLTKLGETSGIESAGEAIGSYIRNVSSNIALMTFTAAKGLELLWREAGRGAGAADFGRAFEDLKREVAEFGFNMESAAMMAEHALKNPTDRTVELQEELERLRQILKDALAGIGDASDAEDRNAKAKKKNLKDMVDAEKEYWKLRKEMWAWEQAQAQAREDAEQAFYDEFYKKDTGALIALFEQRKLTEGQFRAEMAEANEQALIEEWSRRHEIISAALATEMITYEEAATRRMDVDRQLASDRVALGEETEAIIAQQHEDNVRLFADLLGASAKLFGALQNILQQMYEDGDEEAKAHAERLFYIQQAFALAMAIVNTALSISTALASGPPPGNIIQAAIAGVAGAAEIATIVGTTIKGIGDAGIPPGALQQAGLNQHTGIIMRNDEMLIDPVGTRHISEMLEIQKSQMAGGAGGDRTIRTTVELDGRVLGESVDNYLVRQQERGIPYTDRVRGSYL